MNLLGYIQPLCLQMQALLNAMENGIGDGLGLDFAEIFRRLVLIIRFFDRNGYHLLVQPALCPYFPKSYYSFA